MIRRPQLLFLLVGVWPFAALAAKDQGKILDRAALERVQDYCVTSELADDPLDVENFVKEQGKPKGLLKKLPWQKVEDCGNSGVDATIELEFVWFSQDINRATRDKMKSILRVLDNSTSGIIYTAEAMSFESNFPTPDHGPRDDVSAMQATDEHQRRLDALRRVFLMLIHDVKALPPRPAR